MIDIKFDILDSSNNDEGAWVVICGDGRVVFVGVVMFVGIVEAMDSGSDTMKDNKLEALTMVDWERAERKMMNQETISIQACLKWIQPTHPLFIHYINGNRSWSF